MTGMIWLGIILFSAFVLFTLVTLPVELDASKRAVAVLERSGMITSQEVEGTRKVLTAAALTYVAAAIGAVLQLVYLLWRAGILGQQRNGDWRTETSTCDRGGDSVTTLCHMHRGSGFSLADGWGRSASSPLGLDSRGGRMAGSKTSRQPKTGA